MRSSAGSPASPVDSLRSPLRYPGGKARVMKQLAPFIPPHGEYREIFAGGASMFFARHKASRNWLNDLHPGLYAFYTALRDHFGEFEALCRRQTGDLRERFSFWIDRTDLMTAAGDDALVERAVQFYFINRTVWTGRVVYDPARRSRLYFSNPEGWGNLERKLALLKLASLKLQGVKVSRLPFEQCLQAASRDTFIYADPPYMRDSLCSRTDRLYDGRFPLEAHTRLASLASRLPAKILISYDDCPEVRALYPAAQWRIVELHWKYCGRHAVTNEHRALNLKEQKVTGRELVILNY